MDYTVERITAAEARPMRRALLHPGLTPEAVDYPGDGDDLAVHLGAFVDGMLVGVGTIHPQPIPAGEQEGVWRLRDLAVEHGHRGRGIGGMLLTELRGHAGDRGGRLTWAAIRVGAVGFFEHHGFTRFEVPWSDPNEGEQRLMLTVVRPLLRDWKLRPVADS